MTSFFTLMAQLFEVLNTLPRRDFGAGETIIAEDSTTGMLFFLIDGEVEVYKDDVPLAATSEPGSVFGEMSALLGTSHRASVKAVTPSRSTSWKTVADSWKVTPSCPCMFQNSWRVVWMR